MSGNKHSFIEKVFNFYVMKQINELQACSASAESSQYLKRRVWEISLRSSSLSYLSSTRTNFSLTSCLAQKLACQLLNKATCQGKETCHFFPSTRANKTCQRKLVKENLLVQRTLDTHLTRTEKHERVGQHHAVRRDAYEPESPGNAQQTKHYGHSLQIPPERINVRAKRSGKEDCVL